MDGDRFDHLTRSLAGGLPRRGLLRLLAGALVGGAPTIGAAGADAAQRTNREDERTADTEGATAEIIPCDVLCTLIGKLLIPGAKATCTKACKTGDSLVERMAAIIEALVKKGQLKSSMVIELLVQLFKRGVLDAKQVAAVVEKLVKSGVLKPSTVINFLAKLFKNEILTLKQFTALLKELVKKGVVKLCGGDVLKLCIESPDQITCCEGAGLCENGTCQCPTGKVPCGGACHAPCGTNEKRDPNQGCACVCNPGRTRCDGICVKTGNNLKYCEGCNPCQPTTCFNASCQNGICSKTKISGCCLADDDCGACERCSEDHKCVADTNRNGDSCPVEDGTGTCCDGACVGCEGGSVDLATCSCVGSDGCICTLKANGETCGDNEECCTGVCWFDGGEEMVCKEGEGCAGEGTFCSAATANRCCSGLCRNCRCACQAPGEACGNNRECCGRGMCTESGCCLLTGEPATNPADCCSGVIDSELGQCARGEPGTPCSGPGDCEDLICCLDRCCPWHEGGTCNPDSDPPFACFEV